MKISFSGKKFRFISSFDDFTIETIKPYMSIHDDVEKLIRDSIDKYKDLEIIGDKIIEVDKRIKEEKSLFSKILKNCKDCFISIKEAEKAHDDKISSIMDEYSSLETSMNLIDSELSDLQFKITLKRIDLLCCLCENKKFRSFIENTKGVTRGLINIALDHLLKKLGSFTDYWESCRSVSTFKIKMSGRIMKQVFKVHEMSKTTLVRETLASVQAQTALNYKQKLDAGSFDHICRFIAILVRPEKEKEEISFVNKSFINGNKIKGLDPSEKLSLYAEELEKAWTKREKDFKKLPLSIAIGVLKEYFAKKKT